MGSHNGMNLCKKMSCTSNGWKKYSSLVLSYASFPHVESFVLQGAFHLMNPYMLSKMVGTRYRFIASERTKTLFSCKLSKKSNSINFNYF